MTAEFVIRGGTVVDGTGAPGVRADVAVDDGVVVAVGAGLEGRREVDARGLVVAPGFIDIHTHYDAQVLWDPALTPSCWHGVTTVISGNCGFSLAPCRPEHRDLMVRTLEHVEAMSPEALRAGVRWEFETFPEYLGAVERQGTLLNFGAYVGHTAVRLYVMGEEAYERAATDGEIAAMARVVAEAVEAGAIGFATSQAPTHQGANGRPVPSRHASLAEIEALARAVASTGRGVVQILPGTVPLDEVYEMQLRVGRPFTWTALLTGFGDYHRHAVEKNLRYREAGARVWPQMAVRPLVFQFTMAEPFNFDTVAMFAELYAVSREERKRRYADPAWRAKAQEALDSGPIRPQWHKLIVAETTARPDLLERSLADIAAEWGVSPIDVACEIALADDLATRFRGVLANDDPDAIAELLTHDELVIGLSDAGAHGAQLCDACFSTELLGTFVRERGAIPLETAVRKITGQLADVFGITGRGYLAPGYAADICIFDPETIAPGPLRRVWDLPAGADRLLADAPTGIAHLFVNGVEITGGRAERLPGRIVRPA